MLKIIVISLLFLLANNCFAVNVTDNEGLTNNDVLLVKLYDNLKSQLNLKRREYESMQGFMARKSKSQQKLDDFIDKTYSMSLAIESIKSSWEAGTVTLGIRSAVPLIMPRSSGVNTGHVITFPADSSKSREYKAFPKAMKVIIKFNLTQEGYGIVSDFKVTYRGNNIHSRKS